MFDLNYMWRFTFCMIYDTLLQDLGDMSRESDSKQEQITEQKEALVDVDKQKAVNICDIAMKNLKESQ